jgi:endonuclease/exonuclease/phosphatase (EEP) superfamily protein YafD
MNNEMRRQQQQEEQQEEQRLRDTFAAHALNALVAKDVGDPAWTARLAYSYADSMMLKRTRGIQERREST